MEKFELFFSYTEEREMIGVQAPLDSISDMLECLEGATKEIRLKGLQGLYHSLLKNFQDSSQFTSTLNQIQKQILDQGGLSILIHHLSFISSSLELYRDLQTEQELRFILNILYSLLLFTPSEEIQSELIQNTSNIEDFIFSMIHLSTELSYIPIKKVCLLFHQYLKIILDSPTKHKYTNDSIKKEQPRYKVQSSAVENFYKRVISKENLMSQLVVGLLRSLLACCPAASSNSSQGVEIKQEYLSVLLNLAQESIDDLSETDLPDEARHRCITAFAIGKVLLLLIKKFRLNHYLQFQYLSQLVNEASGSLVFLKFLNLDTPELPKRAVLPALRTVDRDLLVQKTLKVLTLVCYKVNKGHPDRITNNLVKFKSHLIFKKIFNKFPNKTLEVPCLKILRIQIKYLTKKWKSYASNMKIISEIYQKLKPSKEDWISDLGEEVSNSEELKTVNHEFNYYNYWQPLECLPPESPQIPQDFSESYEEWLEDNVWGYSYMY